MGSVLKQLAAVLGLPFFSCDVVTMCIAATTSSFSVLLERQAHVILVMQHVMTGTGHACRYSLFLFGHSGEVQLCT